MDAFKLLSRATKLRPDKKGGIRPLNDIPSSGNASNPQLFGNDAGAGHAQVHSTQPATKQTTKRKRGRDGPDEAVDLPAELEFFADRGSERDTNESENGSRSTTKPTALEAEEKSSGTQPKSQGNLDAEECKRILSAHKLKITLLDSSGANEPAAKSTKKSKKAKQAPELSKKQKKHAARLFPKPLTDFEHLRGDYGISRRLAENVKTQGYSVPTEVQLGSLPLLLRRRGEKAKRSEDDSLADADIDLLTVAPTGSGKTIAFLIPALDGLLRGRREEKVRPSASHGATDEPTSHVKALIVAPTKELASQIVNEGRKLANGTGIKVAGMQKGMLVVTRSDRSAAEDRLEHPSDDPDAASSDQLVKADVLVTTPLMLLHSLEAKSSSPTSLPSVKYLILDEADVLLDPLFRTQTLGIWTACTNPALRVSLWSATIGSNIECLARETIAARRAALSASTPPRRWRLVRLVVGLKDSAVPNISHRLVYTATESGKLLALRQLLHPSSPSPSPPVRPPLLVFTQTIPRALALHSELLYDIPPQAGGSARLAVLHASLSDTARADVMARFRRGEVWVLITTDLLARGVDFRGLNAVVNYDIPGSGAVYVHRVGRTGRAGRPGGVAVTFYTKEDISAVRDVASVIAASERAAGDMAPTESTVQPWLLDALPKPSKKTRKELKRRGVAARREKDEDGKGKARMRISTKSGFERKVENRRRGAVEGSRGRKERETETEEVGVDTGGEAGEWGGFDD